MSLRRASYPTLFAWHHAMGTHYFRMFGVLVLCVSLVNLNRIKYTCPGPLCCYKKKVLYYTQHNTFFHFFIECNSMIVSASRS